MKKIIVAVAVACMAVATSAAQESKGETNQPAPAQRTEQRAQAMAGRMMLDDAARAKFVPLYQEYMEELQAARKAKADGAKRASGLTDREIEESIEADFDARQKRLDVEKAYYKKFKAVLNARQLRQLFGRGDAAWPGGRRPAVRTSGADVRRMARMVPGRKVRADKIVLPQATAAEAPAAD